MIKNETDNPENTEPFQELEGLEFEFEPFQKFEFEKFEMPEFDEHPFQLAPFSLDPKPSSNPNKSQGKEPCLTNIK